MKDNLIGLRCTRCGAKITNNQSKTNIEHSFDQIIWNQEQGEKKALNSLYEYLDQWTSSRALSHILQMFDQKIPSLCLRDRLDWLTSYTISHWDTRLGRERIDAFNTKNDTECPTALMNLLIKLGLRNLTPLNQQYDIIFILGGTWTSCRIRAQYAAELIKTFPNTREVVALAASERAIDQQELINTTKNSRSMFSPKTELEAMQYAVRNSFNEKKTNSSHRSKQRGLRPQIIAVPSSPNGRRPNTAETLLYWRKVYLPLIKSHISSALVVSSPMVALYQNAEAIRVLGIPCSISLDVAAISTLPKIGLESKKSSQSYSLQHLADTIESFNFLFKSIAK